MICYVDVISPYAYLASTQIEAIAARHGRRVELVPVVFGALLSHSGALGPAEIPLKRAYMHVDVLRIAAACGVRISPPPTHPFNPLLALRVATAAPTEARARVVQALFAATWGGAEGSPGVETVEAITAALAAVDIDAAPLLAAASTDAVKQALRRNTEAAIAAGVFGVPTVVVDGELFWGCDSLAHLKRYLSGERTVDPAALARFQALQPSITRR